MRNLRNTRHARLNPADVEYGISNSLVATAWDVSDDSLILAFGPCERNHEITLKRLPSDSRDSKDAKIIASWAAPPPDPDTPYDQIREVHHFSDTKTTTLILGGGDIVTVREVNPASENSIDIVGSVDEGIRAAAWSPDEELVAVSTGANTLLLMTRDFDSIADIKLSPDDLTISSHVSVGWGKKETQFKGRGVAKQLRDPTMPEHVDEGILSTLEDDRTTISWRGDGQYLAINSVLDLDPKRRVIRVYSREGLLESVSEPVNGLEGALAWKPSGQLIAGMQRRQDRLDVVFFEKNGLRHGEFNLRLKQEEMETFGSSIGLRWNADSTVLAVSMKGRVQLWTMGNYHYYLKQEILLGSDEFGGILWHAEKPLHFSCFNQSDLRLLAYRFEVCRGSVTPPHDIGLVAVIDGKILKITPLRTANVPPPMAYDEIELQDNALDVVTNKDGTEIAILHSNSVTILDCDYSAKPPRKASVLNTEIVPRLRTDDCKVLERKGQCSRYARSDHDRIHCLPEWSEKASETAWVKQKLPESHDATYVMPSGESITFQLTDSGMLAIKSESLNQRIPGCTSFITTQSHLIYTTSQHLLKFVHLRAGVLDIPPDEPEKDERCRSIERGAKIVTVIPSTYSLILQMPRGNLETIYPRALVLPVIRDSLQQRHYRKAFLICRKQRVDMNILHDYAPKNFLRDVGIFIEQVHKAEYLDLFLSSLTQEDVSVTMYKDTLALGENDKAKNSNSNHITSTDTELSDEAAAPNRLPNGVHRSSNAQQDIVPATSKINRICDTFLLSLQKQPETRTQNLVTAHVCKNPPDLEAGVQLVSNLRKEAQIDDSVQDRLQQAVEHICFLADVNQLYDAALGGYDLDVALLIAQQSQKDPREYLPYLQELHEMSVLRRRFKIDDDLKRHRKALDHLYELDVFDEVENYTVKHDLYPAAIELYRYDNNRLRQLMRSYADHLNSRNKFKEAGVAYEYISDHRAAYEAYRGIGMWRECLANAALIPLPSTELSSLAQDLAASLEEAKDYNGAATIHLDYLDDLSGSARLLCKGLLFAEAMRQVTLRQQPALLQKVIDPGLVEASATITELLAEMKSQVAAQVPRLRELRQKKADDPMAFLDGVDGGDGDVPDNISLAPTDASTSGGTFMTRYTNRSTGTLATNATRKTSKNRRREERKRARGKKGTVYEEEYLVNSITRLIERLNDVGKDISSLIEGLMRRAMRERAVAVQAAMDDVFTMVSACMPEVYISVADTPSAEPSDQPIEDPQAGEARPWGGQGVLWDVMTSNRPIAPVLKSFARLTLLP